eukprot:scaffold31331_cov125-Isochrysis_galbana.AAC.2
MVVSNCEAAEVQGCTTRHSVLVANLERWRAVRWGRGDCGGRATRRGHTTTFMRPFTPPVALGRTYHAIH